MCRTELSDADCHLLSPAAICACCVSSDFCSFYFQMFFNNIASFFFLFCFCFLSEPGLAEAFMLMH